MNLTSKASLTVYDEYGQDNSLIRVAGTTCYRSEDKTKLTADGFTKMLKKNNHTAMLEFSWFPIVITCADLFFTTFLSGAKYLEFSIQDKEAIVSGNGRAWLDYINTNRSMSDQFPLGVKVILEQIADLLNKTNPILFDFKVDQKLLEAMSHNYKVRIANDLVKQSLQHRWLMVKYFGVTRAFTHQVVRHRTMSFAQMSTRYVECSNFEFAGFPDGSVVAPELGIEYNNWLEHTKEMYQSLKDAGYKNDIARQVLPNGLTNEICVAGRVKDWYKIFDLRTPSDAHWEIRAVMQATQNTFKEILNGTATDTAEYSI